MSANGSVLGKFSTLELGTADGKHYTLKTSPLKRLALRLIGAPHLGFRGRARIILDRALQLPRDAKVLDAGCGYGLYSLTLAYRGFSLIDALDLDSKRIAALKNMFSERPELRDRIRLHVGSVTALPFADSSFDLVICSEVVEHVPDELSALRELCRVLKPGGKLLLSVPYLSEHNKKIYKVFEHERPGYTKERLAEILGGHGVKIVGDGYYEYRFGTWLFDTFNKARSVVLMGILFYPFYALYRIDAALKIGQPNGIVIEATKS